MPVSGINHVLADPNIIAPLALERALWPAYREAYEIALERTSTPEAPWYVVPADRKWFRDLAIAQLLLATLRGLDPQWPPADFDVTHERARLTGEEPIA